MLCWQVLNLLGLSLHECKAGSFHMFTENLVSFDHAFVRFGLVCRIVCQGQFGFK